MEVTTTRELSSPWSLKGSTRVIIPRNPADPILRAGMLAPSGYNSQPWKFSLPEPGAINVLADWSRARPVIDPDGRELFLSLGAVVENMLVAASHMEFAAAATLLGETGQETGVRIRLLPGGFPDLIEPRTIRSRRTNRSHYSSEPVAANRLAALEQSVSTDGVLVNFTEPAAHAELIRKLYLDAHAHQRNQPGFLDEFLKWSRFTERNAERLMDGLVPDAVRVPKLRAGMGRKYIRQYSTPEQQAELDLAAIASSPHLAIVSVREDSRKNWIAAGRSLERLQLLATQFGIASAYHNAPCQVPEVRKITAAGFGLGDGRPVAIVRLGYGPSVPATSRRPLREFISL